MSVQELNLLPHICELKRTQWLTTLAMSLPNPPFAGYLYTQNLVNFVYQYMPKFNTGTKQRQNLKKKQ